MDRADFAADLVRRRAAAGLSLADLARGHTCTVGTPATSNTPSAGLRRPSHEPWTLPCTPTGALLAAWGGRKPGAARTDY